MFIILSYSDKTSICFIVSCSLPSMIHHPFTIKLPIILSIISSKPEGKYMSLKRKRGYILLIKLIHQHLMPGL